MNCRYSPCVIAALLLASLLAGCAAPRTKAPNISPHAAAIETERQRELAAKRVFRDRLRLWQAGAPLLMAGAELCGTVVTPYLGLQAYARQDFTGAEGAALSRVLGLTDRPEIVAVLPESPAEDAGFQVGDVLLQVGTRPVPTGRPSEVLADILDAALISGQPVTFKVSRDSQTEYLTATPAPRCDYALVLSGESDVNAQADGESVFVTQGMLRFVETDQHLAVVIGHEIAHNVMEHGDAKQSNAIVAGAGGLLLDLGLAVLGVNTGGAFMEAAAKAGAQAYSVGFEQEADYIGLYFLARAGYPLDGAADVWRLMAAESPESITHRGTHPTTPERFLAIEDHIWEIKLKQANQEPLLPEILPDPDAGRGDGNSLLKSEYPD